MQERASEIRWTFQVESSPGNGTLIRVEKEPEEGSRDDSNGH
jgi:nitrate/nitrite-specific signal transduction histidine kinase